MIALFFKILRDKRWMMLGWFLGMASLAIFTISFFPSFKDTVALDELMKSLPPQFQGLVGSQLSFKRFDSYVASQVFDIRLPLLAMIAGVILAVNVTATEEDEGTLKTLQTLPIARSIVVLSKWLAMGMVLVVVSAGAFAGVILGALFVNEPLSVTGVAFATLQLWLLAWSIGSFAFMVGLATGKKGLTTAAGSLFAVYNFLVASLGASVDELENVYKATVYYYYHNPQLIVENPQWWNVFILLTIAVVFLCVTLLFYRRRDIAG